VARRRCAGSSSRAVDPAREAPVGVLDAHRLPQRDRLDVPALRVPDGPADGPVHLHRLRRLRPRRGGDEERLASPHPAGSSPACSSR
jgi:hypothetical protein